MRDYIHVVDLALGHLKALAQLIASLGGGVQSRYWARLWRVGAVAAFEKACGKPIHIGLRHAGLAMCQPVMPSAKANRELGWSAKLDLADMCRDAWRWQSQNPAGYA